jgi:hypothetical protein
MFWLNMILTVSSAWENLDSQFWSDDESRFVFNGLNEEDSIKEFGRWRQAAAGLDF